MSRIVTAVLVAGTLAACHGSGPDATERASWAATARMVVDAWRRGAVPTRYAADTLRLVARRLDDAEIGRTADRIASGDRDVAPPRR